MCQKVKCTFLVQFLLMLYASFDESIASATKDQIDQIDNCSTNLKNIKDKTLIVNYCEEDSDTIFKFLTDLLNEKPNIFIVEIKVNDLIENFESFIIENLQVKIMRPIIIKIHSKSKKNEHIFVFKYSGYLFNYANKFISKIMSYNYSVDDPKFEEDHSNILTDAMNNGCDVCIRFAVLTDERFLTYSKMNNVSESDSLNCDAFCFKALLDLPYNFDFSGSYDGLYLSTFSSYIDQIRNSSKSAVKTPQEEREIKFKLDGITGLAWKIKEYEIFDFLIRNDFQFPDNFIQNRQNGFSDGIKDNKYIQNLETLIAELETFQRDIKIGNFEKVKEFLEKHKKLSFARDLSNKSALKAAVDSNQTEIFAYLRSNGMSFATYQELADYYKPLNDLPDTDCKLWKIFNFNRKYMTSVSKTNSIAKLLEMSKFNYDHQVHTKEDIESIIKYIYVTVNEIIPEIVAVVSNSPDLEINFDFMNSNIIDLQPTGSWFGVTDYDSKYINIGAKDILSENITEHNYALGTVGHEFMHHAMYQVYDNYANPYYKNDMEIYNKLVNISEKCKQLRGHDILINKTNEYDEDEIINELIARVPNILLTYRHNQTYINDLKVIFSDLFNFYYDYVLPDARDYIKTIAVSEKVREFNNWLGLVVELENNDQINSNMSDVTEIRNYLNDKNERGIKIFPTLNSKSAIYNFYMDPTNSKIIAIYMPISFLEQHNFNQVMFKIYGFPVDVPIIIHSDKNVKIGDLNEKFNKSTLKKIVVVEEATKSTEPVPTESSSNVLPFINAIIFPLLMTSFLSHRFLTNV